MNVWLLGIVTNVLKYNVLFSIRSSAHSCSITGANQIFKYFQVINLSIENLLSQNVALLLLN